MLSMVNYGQLSYSAGAVHHVMTQELVLDDEWNKAVGRIPPMVATQLKRGARKVGKRVELA